MVEIFVIGSETVSYYKGTYYVTGPGYEYGVLLYDNTYHITGKPRYKEVVDFFRKTSKQVKGSELKCTKTSKQHLSVRLYQSC